MSDYQDPSQGPSGQRLPTNHEVFGDHGPPEDEVDLIQILGILWRNLWIVVLTTALAGGVTFTYALISLLLPPETSYMPDLYEPNATLLVNEDAAGGAAAALQQAGGLADMAGLRAQAPRSYGQLATQLVNLRSLQDKIIEEFNLIERWEIEESPKTRSRRALSDRTSVEYEPETGFLTISMEDKDPEFTHRVVNRYVELLEERFTDLGTNRALQRKELLESQLTDLEADILELENRIEDFQLEHEVASIEAFASRQTEELADVRSRLMMKELEIQTYSELARIEDPEVQRLRAERDNLQRLATEMEEGWETFPGDGPALSEVPRLQRNFARLERELRVKSRIFESLSQQYEVERMNAEGREPILQVLELAEVPDQKSAPARSIMVIVATAAGFFLGIFLAFLAHFVRNVRNDPDARRRFHGEA